MTSKSLHRPLIFALLILSLFTQSTALGQTNTTHEVGADSSSAAYFQPLVLNPSIYDSPYKIALFTPQNGEDGARVWSQSKSIFFAGLGVFAVLAALPEESTGWEKTDDIFDKWVENVKDGPEWDRNDWAYNYLGHMYVGGVYYQIARKSGYRQWDSFIYTCMMSTFYWEYGVEAFAEIPSIQDLVYTPIAGWIYGEWAFQTEMGIRSRDNKVLGSGLIGGACLIALDPIDSLGRGLNFVTRHNLVKAGYGYFSYVPSKTTDGETDHQVYLNMRIPLGVSGPTEPNEITEINHQDDPVDTGILGFGGGVGYTALDGSWKDKYGVKDGLYNHVSLGVYFTPRVSTLLEYAWGDLKDRDTGQTVEYENYHLNTQLYMNPKGKFRPYVTGGLGRQTWFRDNDTANFQWNGGLGAHWQFYRKLSLNADWLNYYSPSTKTYDQQFNAGITYRFGRGERDDWY